MTREDILHIRPKHQRSLNKDFEDGVDFAINRVLQLLEEDSYKCSIDYESENKKMKDIMNCKIEEYESKIEKLQKELKEYADRYTILSAQMDIVRLIFEK